MGDNDLYLGSKGDAVTAAQTLLNYHLSARPPLTNYGVYDADTRDRVKEYQRLVRIHDDGVVGIHMTKTLIPVGQLELKGALRENSVLPPMPKLQLAPSLREFPKFMPKTATGAGLGLNPKVTGSPGSTPDWFYNRLPVRSYHLDNWQLSLGNETDIPKGSDSAPLQFALEFTWLKKRDENPQPAAGIQISHTPLSDDGKWSGQIYGKIGMNDWPLKPLGPISFTNPSIQAYIRKGFSGSSPWTAGAQIANETDLKVREVAGSYSLQLYLNVAPIQLDIFNINDRVFSFKAASTIGIGLKVTFFTPEWKGAPPGISDK